MTDLISLVMREEKVAYGLIAKEICFYLLEAQWSLLALPFFDVVPVLLPSLATH